MNRVRGCLLGGAIGDALGGPVEFLSAEAILAAHPGGVRVFAGNEWPAGSITDDTQMTLFTVEGLIRGDVGQAYDRWLDTQLLPGPSGRRREGWLQGEQWLSVRRAPGNTCLTALAAARQAGSFGEQAVNDSKGCGGVMRVAPFGLIPDRSREWVFDAAAEAAGYTHGHPTGKLAAGALAVIIREVVAGARLEEALDTAQALLTRYDHHTETSAALATARESAARKRSAGGEQPLQAGSPAASRAGVDVVAVERLGGGWVAEEALAIAVYAALRCQQPEEFLDALELAVTHSGDSDSTGAICGNILGALHGDTALPVELADGVEGRSVIVRLADEFSSWGSRRSR